jgi:hypothetical protein
VSWQDWVQLAAVVVAAVAALFALRYARETVRESGDLLRESREQRREERYARLAELAGDYSVLLAHPAGALEADATLPPAREQLRAHVTAAGDPLPACEALLALDRSAAPKIKADATEAALKEIGSSSSAIPRPADRRPISDLRAAASGTTWSTFSLSGSAFLPPLALERCVRRPVHRQPDERALTEPRLHGSQCRGQSLLRVQHTRLRDDGRAGRRRRLVCRVLPVAHPVPTATATAELKPQPHRPVDPRGSARGACSKPIPEP